MEIYFHLKVRRRRTQEPYSGPPAMCVRIVVSNPVRRKKQQGRKPLLHGLRNAFNSTGFLIPQDFTDCF